MPRQSARQESHDSGEEPADLMNNLALGSAVKVSSPVATSISEGRRYPKRERQAIYNREPSPKKHVTGKFHSISVTEHGIEPTITTEASGKLNRPRRNRTGDDSRNLRNRISKDPFACPEVPLKIRASHEAKNDRPLLSRGNGRPNVATHKLDPKIQLDTSAAVAESSCADHRPLTRAKAKYSPPQQIEEPSSMILKESQPMFSRPRPPRSENEVDEALENPVGLDRRLESTKPASASPSSIPIKETEAPHTRRTAAPPSITGTEANDEMQDESETGFDSAGEASDLPSDDSGDEDDDDAEDYKYVEFYDKEKAWGIVLKGARKIGVSNSREPRSLPTLETRVITYLVKITKDARRLFDRLLYERDLEEDDVKELEAHLEKALAEIDQKVMELSEPPPGKKRSQVVKDIYAHAIPKLVFMLRSALRYRNLDYSEPDDLKFLTSMISIQKSILLLCKKAALWKIKTNTETSITVPTTQEIVPYLRDVSRAFQRELEWRKTSSAKKQTDLELAESHEKRFKRIQKEKKENLRQRKENSKRMKDDLDRRWQLLFGISQREKAMNQQISVIEDHRPEHLTPHFVSTDRWSDEQNLELLVQLQNPVSRYLPGLPHRSSSHLKL